MGYPDSSVGNQFSATGFVSNIDFHNRVDVQLDALIPRVSDTGYTTATLGNSWAALGSPYATPGYRLKGGWTGLQGGLKSGTSAAAIFTLPVGMRPLGRKLFIVPSGTGSAGVIVDTTGVVSVSFYTSGGSNASVWFDQISFIAEQ